MLSEDPCDWDEDDDGVRSELSAKRDSINLNSLDCWDYSIELECLKGPEGKKLKNQKNSKCPRVEIKGVKRFFTVRTPLTAI